MGLKESVQSLIEKHDAVRENVDRSRLIKESVEHREALVSKCGALATWTPPESTGRSPKDTVAVRRKEREEPIDWDSPNNIPIDPSTFDMLVEDAVATLSKKDRLYVNDRVLGADPSYALPVRFVTDRALHSLFIDNMFRPVPKEIETSVFHERPFTLIAVPYDKLDPKRYEGRLRTLPGTNKTSNMAIAVDFDRYMGVVYGSAYAGSCKKLMFTVMNYVLPGEGILPLHTSANEGPDGDIALFLGLSGTGKTTLSADPERALLGDDEHGWNANGIANFENGCYAKMIKIDPSREPEIYHAVTHEAPYLEHGAMVENAMMYPDGSFDWDDKRLTENSRASYPLAFLRNTKPSSTGGHPRNIIFLTADANGVLPPVARLSPEQAMLWFLMGYTSKLAGTETGIVDPVATFSRFFGQPFMPRNPDVYAGLLGDYMKKYGAQVWLVNTGWSGGPYGEGERMDINLTRSLLRAVLSGSLSDVAFVEDSTFHVMVPKSCPGIDDQSLLHPKNTWADKNAYEDRAKKLAEQFSQHFDKAYGNKGIDAAVVKQCPGK
ncbi:MAG: phosphoenolpyruvate carboxykinase (ATP) [Candidatus Eisenbacteria bacterium]|nr:phosphoenolpyruvate carboxykinase (ATP) [Candidatus Latescibacterota bacterium]MBD3303344.1 phosphoenolpyruvate carboxykinase (ATP) [Candidatus Eisenbacteria bacterium]